MTETIERFEIHVDDAVLDDLHRRLAATRLPDQIDVETGFPADVQAQLEKMGYKVSRRGSIGRTEVIRVSGGKIEAVGDSRGEDTAEGY